MKPVGVFTPSGVGAALDVTHTIQRSDYLLAELGAFFEDGVDHVRGSILASRQALIVRFVAEQFVANEADITQGALYSGIAVNLYGGFLSVRVTERLGHVRDDSRRPAGTNRPSNQTGV